MRDGFLIDISKVRSCQEIYKDLIDYIYHDFNPFYYTIEKFFFSLIYSSVQCFHLIRSGICLLKSQQIFIRIQYFSYIINLLMNLSDIPQKFLEQDSQLNYALMKKLLNQGLYQLSPSLDSLTKHHLALLSTPGVAEVCLAIHQNNALVDKLTMRGKSVAIVSKQQVLGLEGKRLMPLLDWLIVQIKFYSGIQCFPFVVRQQSCLQQIFNDLSNSFCGILYLDDLDLSKIETQSNFFVLNHRQVCSLRKCSVSEGQFSAYAMAHLVNNQIKGVIKRKNLVKIINLGAGSIKKKKIYPLQKQITQYSPYQIHELIQGKTKIVIKFNDISPLKRIFTQANLMRLKFDDQEIGSISSKMNAIVTDGTSILGLGNIGPMSGLPVMEAKCMMFKLLGKVNIVPVCINPRQTQSHTIQAILNLVHLFKGINLEDIRSPECFTIEKQLQDRKVLPVFHDDQHGTSIAVLAGLINATKLANKDIRSCKIIINGAGAAGLTIARLLYYYGNRNIIVCDTFGTIYEKRIENMNTQKSQVASFTNISKIKGYLDDVIEGANIFIGVSTKNTFKKEWIKLMDSSPIIFALANPQPQISEQEAVEGGCFIYASGKNNRKNQVSNSLVYPGIFRAINQHNIMKITSQMKVKAAQQIARIKGEDANTWEILPSSLNQTISFRISQRLKELI